MTVYHQTWFGLFLFLVYLFVTGIWWRDVFESRFFGPHSDIVGKIYGVGTSFLLLGLISSVFVAWYRLTPVTITVAYGIAACISFIFWHIYAGKYPASHGQHTPDHVYFPGKSVFIFIFFLIWLAGMFFYTVDEVGYAHETPWHVLGNATWIIFFFLSVFIGVFIFSKIKSSIVLLLIILFSFYTHVYLPASHPLPWGGDVWRLIAVEEKLLQGDIEPPVLFGPERTMRTIGSLSVPDALVVPHKYTYGHLWGTTVVLAKVLSINLVTVNKWLIPILWSLLIPVIFYRTGTVLFDSRRKGLLFAWASCLVFTFQAVGALTLPVSLGTLTFFFAVSTLIESMKAKKRGTWPFIILFGLLMCFGYVLHTALFFMLLFASGILLFLQRKKDTIPSTLNRAIYSIGIIAAIFFVPAIELISKSGVWPTVFHWQQQFLQMVGQLSGWFYATMIRPHDIVSGNILFNHTPSYAFITRTVTVWRYHVLFISLAVWGIAIYGFSRAALLKKHVSWQVMSVLGATVIGGYIIGWYVLTGDRLFTRRLDPLMAYALLLFVLFGIRSLVNHISYFQTMSVRSKRSILLIIILSCSWFGTTAFVSGPDMHVISQSEYRVAQFLAVRMDEREIPCVLADTWVLLPLEGLTKERVVGGGFPIDYTFGQKERVALYKEFQEHPSASIVQKIVEVVSASSCYLVLETTNIELVNELGTPVYHKEEEPFMVWKVDLKK